MKNEEVLELIEKLKKTDGISNVSFHESRWDLYFHVGGRYNGNYFLFYIMRSEPNGRTVYQLSSVTDKRIPIKQLLKKLTNKKFTNS